MSSFSSRHEQTGFTIVELLIVIVVIGILAAITIVAYNGVQQKAREAALKSDMANVAKKMAVDLATNDSYALTAAAVDGGAGLPASSGTTYQFHSTANSYCITGTNKNTSFKISDTAPSPNSGGCAGDGVGGVASITNLVTNPGFETGLTTGYGFNGSGGVTGTATVMSDSSMQGSKVLRRVITAGGTSAGFGPYIQVAGLDANEPSYALSAWIRTSKSMNYHIAAERRDSSNANIGTVTGSDVMIPANTWTRITLQMPSLPTMDHITFTVYSGTVSWVVNDWVDYDGLMMTKGTSAPNYADGDSPNWIWNGTARSSTSTGPAL